MANAFGIDYGSVLSRAEEIQAARLTNQFRPKALQLAQDAAETQNAMSAVQLGQAQQGAADDQTLRGLRGAAFNGDKGAIAKMAVINPTEAAQFEAHVNSLDEKGKKEAAEKLDSVGRLLAYVRQAKNPVEAYGQALGMVDPETAKTLPKEYDPQWVDLQLAKSVALKDILDGSMNTTAAAATPQSSLGKLKADLDAGLMSQAAYDAAVQKETSSSAGTRLKLNPETGEMEFTQGGPAGADGMPKLTEGNSKDLGFAARMTGALDTLDPIAGNLTNFWEKMAGGAPAGLGNYMQSEEFQQADQAGQEFITAMLRKDSGAVISPEEKKTYGDLYLPQPGDKPNTLKQKAAARRRAVKALAIGIPAAAIAAAEKAGVDLTVDDAAADAGANAPATIADDAGYNALPSGATFIAPDGTTRKKP